MGSLRRLRRSELPADAAQLARFLLGKVLVHDSRWGRMSGRIVETEAYGVGDAAAHSFRGRTERNHSMFLRPGHAYVYFVYGTWFAMNVSAEPEGVGGGVLLRALEPLEGIERMRTRRTGATDPRLASGPGCLAAALGIDRSLDGANLCASGTLWLANPRPCGGPVEVGTSVRIGITKDAHKPLRFFVRGSPSVSGPRWMQDPTLGLDPRPARSRGSAPPPSLPLTQGKNRGS